MWKKLRLLLVLLLVLTFVAPIVFVVVALEDEARLTDVAELSSDDVRRARELIDRSDPRGLADGEVATLQLGERDVDLMLAYALDRLDLGVSRVQLAEGAADVMLSLNLPDNPLGNYLNVDARVASAGPRELSVESLKVGGLGVPGFIANWGARSVNKLLSRDERYAAAVAALDTIEIQPTHAFVQYRWQRDLAEEVVQVGRETFSGNLDTDLISVYFEEARRFGAPYTESDRVSLAELVPPLFALASRRSIAGGDAVAENRAAVLGMSIYALGVNPDLILSVDASAPDLQDRPEFRLRNRNDLAKHFLMSATLTAATGSILADAVGLQKEVLDSQGGSGFSFVDLAADRAGVRFFERATESASAAARVQARFSVAVTEDDFMPAIDGLAEGMSEEEFARRYEGVGSEPYRQVVAGIERRIDALPLFD